MKIRRNNLTTIAFALLLSFFGSLIVASPAAAATYICTGYACADSSAWAAAPKITRFGYPYNAGTGSGTNCTNYLAWKLSMNGASGLSGLGNANRWDDNARARGITVDNTPAVGAVAQWDTGGYGHVAYVESVNGNSIVVSEANYGGNWLDRRQMSVSEVGSFIHIKDLVVTSTPLITPGDFNGDGFKDLLHIRANGDLALYANDGSGGWLNGMGTVVGAGWNSFSHAFSPGDFNGDGKSDVIGVTSNGNMMLYTGDGAGGWLNGAGTLISTGNIWAQMIAPGDFNSDGFNDVIGVTTAGELWLYKGNGAGGWIGTGTAIGAGFAGVKFLVTPGDFSGDGNVDLIATLPNGTLSMYTGDGAGGWSNGTGIVIGSGFASATRMVGPGDWNGDGNVDVIASLPNGDLRVYTGNGAGSWINGNGILIGSGW